MGFPFLSLLTHTGVKKLNEDSSSKGHLQFLLRLYQHVEYLMEGILWKGDKANIAKLHLKTFLESWRGFLRLAPTYSKKFFDICLSSATFKVYYIIQYYFFINFGISGIRVQCEIKHC